MRNLLLLRAHICFFSASLLLLSTLRFFSSACFLLLLLTLGFGLAGSRNFWFSILTRARSAALLARSALLSERFLEATADIRGSLLYFSLLTACFLRSSRQPSPPWHNSFLEHIGIISSPMLLLLQQSEAASMEDSGFFSDSHFIPGPRNAIEFPHAVFLPSLNGQSRHSASFCKLDCLDGKRVCGGSDVRRTEKLMY